MPIFEFKCSGCGHHFEQITGSTPSSVECPKCSSKKVEKQLSRFAVGNGSSVSGAPSFPSPCGSCGDPRGPGACSWDDD
ncbi:MAG: zinc ribbon domain-containing protein [Deltaproteobacteria bacterium]|nr:zinc ribbon domain-containing protein [Deltaproteobacteria bacterium]